MNISELKTILNKYPENYEVYLKELHDDPCLVIYQNQADYYSDSYPYDKIIESIAVNFR